MSQPFQEISRNILLDGNDESPYYELSNTCGCHRTSDRTCMTSRCLNYATLTECMKCSNDCQNNKFQTGCCVKLEVRLCEEKGNGLFCLEDLKKGQFVKEYVGEIVSEKELQKRLKASQSLPHLYVMELKTGSYLDARHRGSISRYINHSCEPNCTVEVWTVGRKLRVGIFTLKAITSGTELTFDYRWERSTRPPTKCYCGTPSCRGFLEVDESDDEIGDQENYQEKTGRWVSNLEAYKAALQSLPQQAATETEKKQNDGGDWLVKKRIKVWWEGNQRHFDADVLSYDSSTGMHTIQYLVDGQISKEMLCLNQQHVQEKYSPWKSMTEENLHSLVKNNYEDIKEEPEGHERKEIDSSSHLKVDENNQLGPDIAKQSAVIVKKGIYDWQWLNEEKSDYVIKKKSEEVLDHWREEDEEETKVIPPSSLPSGDNWKSSPSATTPSIKLLITISLAICRRVLAIIEEESTEAIDYPQPLHQITQFGVIMRLFREVIKSRYQTFVRSQSHTPHQPNEFESKEEEIKIALYGSRANVEIVHQIILKAYDIVRSERSSSRSSLYSSLLRSQPSILTVDWRRKISSESLHLLASLSHNSGITTPITDIHISAYTPLSLVPLAATTRQHQTSSLATDDPVLKTTRTALVNLCKTVNTSLRVEFHALVLLQRCLDMLPSSYIGSDVLSLLSACLILSMKINSVFKPKHITIVITEGYALIFQRKLMVENDESSLSSYRDRVLEMEKKLFKTLYCDLFIPDITYLPLYSLAFILPQRHRNSTTSLHRDKEVDTIKQMILLLSTYLYRIGSKSIEMNLSVVQNVHSSTPALHPQQSILCHEVLKIFPVDLLQWSIGLMGCILHSFLHIYEALSSSHPAHSRAPLSHSYLPLQEDIFLDSVKLMVDSASLYLSPRSPPTTPSISLDLFYLFYANTLQYYNSPASPPSKKTNPSPTSSSRISFLGPESVLWGVSVVSHITQFILSSSEIRTLSETLASSQSPSISHGKPHKHSQRSSTCTNNSRFGTPAQWKTLIALVPEICVKWVEKIESPYPSVFIKQSHLLKTKCVTLGEMNDDLSVSPSRHQSLNQIGWLDHEHIQVEYIEDRIPIASTSHSVGAKRKDRDPDKEKGDEETSSSPSSSGIVSGHYSPQILKLVNIYTSTPSLMALLPLPAIKTQLREIKKYQQPSTSLSNSASKGSLNFGLSPLTLSELVMAQYLHYFQPLSSSLTAGGIECPMAVANDPQTLHGTYAQLYYNFLHTTTPEQNESLPSSNISSSFLAPTSPPSTEETKHDPDSVLSLISSHRTQKSKNSQSFPQQGSILGSGQINVALFGSASKSTIHSHSSPSFSPQYPVLSLYSLSPATLSHFPLSSLFSYTSIPSLFSPFFLREMARDILQTISYCHSKGIVFRYISHDSLYLSTNGRVMLQSLQGAVYLYQEYTLGSCLTQSPHLTSKSSKKTLSPGANPSSSSAGPYLAVSAPEVILGAHPTELSSIWAAVSVCYWIFCGLPPVKSPTSDPKKYLQHLYALLGTPGNPPADTQLVNYYSSLPFAQDYGLCIIDRLTQQGIEARSRLEKVLRQQCPPHILGCFGRNPTHSTLSVPDDTSSNDLIEVFLAGLQLNPLSRPSFGELLRMPFFNRSEESLPSLLLQMGKILDHIRSREKDIDLEASRKGEISSLGEEPQQIEEKNQKRNEIDNDLMEEVFGKDWRVEYELQKNCEIEQENERLEKERIEKERRELEIKRQEEEERARQRELEERENLMKRRRQEETHGVRVNGQEGTHFKPRILSQSPIQPNLTRHPSTLPPGSTRVQGSQDLKEDSQPSRQDRVQGVNWRLKEERDWEQGNVANDEDESRYHYVNHPSYQFSERHLPTSSRSSHHSIHSRDRMRDGHYRHRSRSRERNSHHRERG